MKSIAYCRRAVVSALGGGVLLFLLTLSVQAHDPGLSTAKLIVGEQQIEVLLGFAKQDAMFMLQANGDLTDLQTAEAFEAARSELECITETGFSLYFGEERVAPQQTTAQLKDGSNVEILLRFGRTNVPQVRLLSTLLLSLPVGHREFLSAQTAAGASIGEVMLSARKNSYQINLPARSSTTHSSRDDHSFLEFLELGVEHILTGYDHLLFLFGLMIVCRNLRSVLTVITCFTGAHSITLGLATLDIVRLPGRIVEPMIAASIVYVGIENLFHGDSPKWRTLIAFSFGLVHGLGFADALRELGIGSGKSGIVAPLVGFNLGVEAGQLCVAAIALPILWHLRQNPSFVRRWIPLCSITVALVGSYWMVERIAQN